MRLRDFMQFLGIAWHFHSSDIDRLAPEPLLAQLSEMTGTALHEAMGTLLRNRVRLLPVSEVQIESPSWAWLIPLGHSRRSGRMAGYQFCPVCLATDPPYFRWQWSVALCCCCIVHRTLLTDRCPGCASAIHSNPHGLLGALRTLGDDQPFSLERCTNCRFDFRRAQVQLAPESLIQSQSSYENLMRTKGQGTEVIEFFAVLRQIVSLLFGENRGLEELRQVVARRSGAPRIDMPNPYEPDAEILSFEEADVHARAAVLNAAGWLIQDWPTRFVTCCRDAEVRHPALNRKGVVSVRWFLEATVSAYEPN
jgi:hypothetical protein